MYLVIVSRESLEGDVVVEILILVEGQLDLWMKFSILTPEISFLAWFFLLQCGGLSWGGAVPPVCDPPEDGLAPRHVGQVGAQAAVVRQAADECGRCGGPRDGWAPSRPPPPVGAPPTALLVAGRGESAVLTPPPRWSQESRKQSSALAFHGLIA